MEYHRGPDMSRMAAGLRNHFVYHVFNKAGEVIYVGCTHRPGKRWQEHRRDPIRRHMVAEAHRFKMFGPYDFPAARRIERADTFDLRPKHNTIPASRDRKEAAWFQATRPYCPYIEGISA